MKPAPFEYLAPESVEEVVSLLVEHGDEAKILAGGQSLVPTMNFRMAQPAVLIDINGIDELSYIRESESGINIGALTRQRMVERSDIVSRRCPLLHRAMPWIAHAAIRNRGTFGGSLAHADPASELPAVALALEANMVLRGPQGERVVGAEDFFLGLFETAMEPDEVLVEARFADQPAGTGSAILEMARRSGDFALVGVVAVVGVRDSVIERCRISLFSVADHAVLASGAMASLVGNAAHGDAVRAAARIAAQDDIDPGGDLHASAEYRRHLVEVLVRRALEQALNEVT